MREVEKGGETGKKDSSVKQKNERKSGKIADFNYSFRGEINSDYQITYNHCVINHCI